MDWTLKNDTQSVHVGINHRIGICRRNKRTPKRILLGKKHSELFRKECWWHKLPDEPYYYDSYIPILIEFNVPGLYGIAIESD